MRRPLESLLVDFRKRERNWGKWCDGDDPPGYIYIVKNHRRWFYAAVEAGFLVALICGSRIETA